MAQTLLSQTSPELSGTPLLEVHDLGVSFNGLSAVNGLSLSLMPGEVRVLIGANGAGKTTTMDLISGKTKATNGTIRFKGRDITNWTPNQIARAGIGRKFQIPSVFKDLTVAENMQVALCFNPSVFGNLRQCLRRKDRAQIHEILSRVGLEAMSDRPARLLSHGQTQWLEIGMVLAQNPDLVLLDEPTAGMTVQETRKTADIINALRGQHTILVVEHDMTFVRDICHVITVMHQGKKLAEGTVDEIETNPAVLEAYLGG
ncbi:urea ABC transporter ATP-binding protein UrtD [Leptolyngbya sp. FACHB-36]|uniref:urea ABC transporter ATP-binding protein UrtD n=1 Tax=Leptolyngbya sp. FACHB-36 TaxID=2692808 RepID=UPI0016814A38|nr:urea ABC transporter ATP-binding protein UrtD [Leptolyngbya sp. FACHB-36]MBD2019880.1 urea ABC transporter ATP-binding protein UrtD [Leptolyngbya sp. FACHB-36]